MNNNIINEELANALKLIHDTCVDNNCQECPLYSKKYGSCIFDAYAPDGIELIETRSYTLG